MKEKGETLRKYYNINLLKWYFSDKISQEVTDRWPATNNIPWNPMESKIYFDKNAVEYILVLSTTTTRQTLETNRSLAQTCKRLRTVLEWREYKNPSCIYFQLLDDEVKKLSCMCKLSVGILRPVSWSQESNRRNHAKQELVIGMAPNERK